MLQEQEGQDQEQNKQFAALDQAHQFMHQGFRTVTDFLNKHQSEMIKPGEQFDQLGLVKAYTETARKLIADPFAVMHIYGRFWHDSFNLWQNTVRHMMGHDVDPVVKPEEGDRRFRHEQWNENPVFSHLKQSYLIASRAILDTVKSIDDLDERTAQKVDFFNRQLVDAASPTNFAITNPEVIKATLETKGKNLLKGWDNLLADWKRGKGQLNIKMTDFDAFEVGENLAATSGQVVFRNRMMELIQYDPSTPKVFEKPLLVVPPWINKFYVMDMQAKNSLIKWLVDQGHTVFVISWINPDKSYAEVGYEDYLLEGPMVALDVIEEITGEREVNATGYCLGGTLLATVLAYLRAKDDDRILSATFYASLLDFSIPGEISVFVDEEQIAELEKKMFRDGYLDGSSMANSFGMLRANDLIWSFVINNYLLGRDPRAFDLLYWNADSTRMPAKMHSYYLRNMYIKNALREPGGISVDGVPIDLGQVKTPSYFLSASEDHIAPWQGSYIGATLFSGPTRFVLGESGHIAGVINPPDANKYGYFTNNRKLPSDPEKWMENTNYHEGSWWTDWQKWVKKYAGKMVEPREPGSKNHPPIEPAPGSYVNIKLNEDS